MINFAELVTEEAQTARSARTEWTGTMGSETVTLYAKPLCGADFDKLAGKGYRDFMANPTLGGMVLLIAMKAETEAGQKCFNVNRDVKPMKLWNQDKIAEIFGALFGDQLEAETDEEFEARVGNSGVTRKG